MNNEILSCSKCRATYNWLEYDKCPNCGYDEFQDIKGDEINSTGNLGNYRRDCFRES